jgi:hypothetical protein
LATWLSALGPYLDVQAVLAKVGQIGLSASTAWHKVQQYGARAQALEEVQRRAATALPSRREPIAGTVRQGPRQGVALDGGMVPIRHEGWAAHIAKELLSAAERAQARPPDAKRAEALATAAGYFRDNQRRMQYQELREELWPIGSGMVESGAKQYKGRFAGPGMRWSRPGINALLPFRSAVMGGTAVFDALWQVVGCPTN